MRNFNTPMFGDRKVRSGTVLFGVGALALAALAGCGSANTTGATAPSAAAAASNTEATPSGANTQGSQSSATSHAILTFDALGGGSNVIEVYPGSADTAHDKTSDGTFEAGQTADVICEEPGRTVNSHPEEGERRRTSSIWYKIAAGGQTYFATGTYADVSGGPIPQC
jgi:hypothetical protein